ncbi:MAG: tripartite tricarboxylate transporter TctB family protein, partial [Devosiaceae bacterium]|nr:tripartite tricarboxylate transporter TctB family protein [Devosiaceae bacterium]
VLIVRPDDDPDWPPLRTFGSLFIAIIVLIAYAYALKPFGFLIPTAIAAGILSFQISPRRRMAVLTGLGLSVGLFLLFKYALGLGLVPFPKSWIG